MDSVLFAVSLRFFSRLKFLPYRTRIIFDGFVKPWFTSMLVKE